jgi:hypothetical protein
VNVVYHCTLLPCTKDTRNSLVRNGMVNNSEKNKAKEFGTMEAVGDAFVAEYMITRKGGRPLHRFPASKHKISNNHQREKG